MNSLGDRVKATRVKRMTLTDTGNRHASSPHRTMLVDCLHGIDRAGRVESAGGGQHRRKHALINLQDGDKEESHGAGSVGTGLV